MGSSVVARGLGAIRVARERYTRGQRAVHAWWWGGGIDVVHERGSGIIGIFVVLRRHTWSQRHTCGHRAATCGPRGALGAIHVAAHARGGAGCTRRARGRSEQRAPDVSKNIGVFCGYALVAGLSRGYREAIHVYAVREWHTRQWRVRSALREGPRGGPKA